MKSRATNAKMLLTAGCLVALAALIACGAPVTPPPATSAPQIVRETVVVAATQVVQQTVIVPGTPQVNEVVVTATPEPTAAPPPAGQPLEKARLSINSKLTPPDPHKQAGLAAFMGLYLMGGQLFRLNPDFSVSPYLAEGYAVSDDGLTYTITLKPDLKFSDGSPLTAEDVVYGYERSVELKNPRLQLLGPVKTFTAKDDRTVEITLEKPFPNLLIGLADHGFSVFPKAKIQADPDFFSKVPLVSSGQYVLTEW